MNTATSKTQSTSTNNSTTTPWTPQANQLTAAFNNAGTAYGKSSQAVAPTNFTAGMTPEQLATFQSMIGYGSNSQLPSVNSANGTDMLTGGARGALGALDQFGGFNPAATNNPDAIAAGAKTYASGLDIPGAVAAAMRDANQEARDVTLPGMENTAAGTGNINSSRTGLSEGLVQRGLAEKAGDLSATLRNNAYDTGAGLTANALTSNNGLNLSRISGMGSLGNLLATGGAGINSQSIADQGNLFNLAATGGQGLQQNNQLGLTNALQQYQSGVSSPYDSLNGLMQIIGSGNWGGTTKSSGTGTQDTQTTPSALQTIGGLMSGFGNLALGMKSDINAKEDIVQVGTLFDGKPVYRFRYKGHPVHHIGLMAQDVEKYNPDAVTEHDGYKYVNYLEATKHIA